jgi:hypothetical protein
MIRTSLQRAQRPGQGGGNGSETAHPDEVIHFRGDEQDLQENALVPTAMTMMQEKVQFPYPVQRALRASFLENYFPVDAAQFRVTARQPKRMAAKGRRSFTQ